MPKQQSAAACQIERDEAPVRGCSVISNPTKKKIMLILGGTPHCSTVVKADHCFK